MTTLSRMIYTTTAGQKFWGKGGITSIQFVGGKDKDELTIYDGFSAEDGSLIFDLYSFANGSFSAAFPFPVLFERGIFLAIAGTATSISIGIVPLGGGEIT